MRVLGGLMGELDRVPQRIEQLESLGYDGAVSAEISNDPFFPLLLAAEHSQRIDLMTAIAVAFARNPMSLANLAHDLNAYSRRGASSWASARRSSRTSRSASACPGRAGARMREFILAMRAIWQAAGTRGRSSTVPGRVLHPHPDDAHVHAGRDTLSAPRA